MTTMPRSLLLWITILPSTGLRAFIPKMPWSTEGGRFHHSEVQSFGKQYLLRHCLSSLRCFTRCSTSLVLSHERPLLLLVLESMRSTNLFHNLFHNDLPPPPTLHTHTQNHNIDKNIIHSPREPEISCTIKPSFSHIANLSVTTMLT